MTKDLTEGNPLNLILGFSIPLLFGFLFQQFYNMVDTVIVGKFLGVDSLAAVGATGAINFLIIGFCMGICSGFAIPIAQKFGAKNYTAMRQFVAASYILSAGFALLMTIVTVIYCRPLMILMKTPGNILDQATTYILIIFAGIPGIILYNLLSGIIRSVGDSKTPLFFLILSSLLNIGLDLLFILGLKAGVAGAALATVISQGVSGILCLIYMTKKFEILRLSRDDWKIRKRHYSILCGMGIPMGLQYSITAIGSVILQAAVNTLGSDAVAAVTAASKISMFFCTPFDAMGNTMATYGGQNTGAFKLSRLKSGVKACMKIGFFYSIAAFIVLYFLGKPMGLLFIDSSEIEILDEIRIFLIINAAFYFPLAIVNIVRFMIQGMGFSRFAILAGIFELVGRAVAAMLLVPFFGFNAVCFASPIAWILADGFLLPAFFYCYKKLERIQCFQRNDFIQTHSGNKR